MISEEQALAHILGSVNPLPSRRVPLIRALGKFVAQDVFARIALPVFDNSAMDGYAVIANSCRVGQSQRLVGEQPAGVDRKLRIVAGEAVRVFTGAPIPTGADAVVMQEDVRREGRRNRRRALPRKSRRLLPLHSQVELTRPTSIRLL